jgi:hypothetical protein
MAVPTNGYISGIILSAIGGLLTLVNVLLGLVLKAHKDSDDERYSQAAHEINQLRQRLHDLSATVGKIDKWQRFQDDDKRGKK